MRTAAAVAVAAAAADAVVGNAAAAAVVVVVVDAFDVVTVVGIVDGVAVDFAAVGVVACTVAVVLVANGVVVGVVVDVVVGVVVGVGNSYLVVEEALVVVVVAVVVVVVAVVAAVELEYVEIAMVNLLDHHQEVDAEVEEQNVASDHFSYVFLLFLLKKFVAILDFSVILFLQTHEIFLLFFAKIYQYVYLDL